VTSYDGDLDDYRRTVLSANEIRPASRERGRESTRPERAKSEKRTPLKQRIAQAEAEIERITGIIAKIDAALALPDLFTRDPKQAAQLAQARAGAESALQRAEEEWLEASSPSDEAAS
jgi:ATP-binding cassette subfamily F protein 3